MCLKRRKNVTRDDKIRTVVITISKCRREWIRVKLGGEKCKPVKGSNIKHQKYKLLLKGENKKMVGMVGNQERFLKNLKKSDNFFNHVGLSWSNIFFNIRLHKILTKFSVLRKGDPDSGVTWIIFVVGYLFKKINIISGKIIVSWFYPV